MTSFLKALFIPALLLLLDQGMHAQNSALYNYQDLSHLIYQGQKDSLKKAWVCPSIYKNRETQKKYKEIWDERTEFITKAITDDSYVQDKDIYPYVQSIINQIVQANRQLIPVKPLFLLDRSPSVNAYSIGGNVIAVNLGLICFARSREELALTIAHELSHNILNHADNAARQKAEWLTSDDYKKSMNAVLDSKYERLSRLQKVLEGYSFNRSRHQRYHESDADSLAILLLKKSNIAFDPNFFLRLDTADNIYKQPLKRPIREYFTAYQLPFEDAWTQKRSKGLSTHTYNFRDTATLEDSLKTHPDCIQRYKQTIRFGTADAKPTPIPAAIHDKATRMLIWNVYENANLTECLYRVMLEKDKGGNDAWYDFMTSNIFFGLFYADRELHRFNAVGVTPKEYISKDYYQVQNMLEQMPRETLEQYCKLLQNGNFWKNMASGEKGLKTLLYTLAMDPDDSEKNRQKAAKEFTTNNSASMYCEFAGNFEKK